MNAARRAGGRRAGSGQPPGPPRRPAPARGVGGEQVEGRQAVRELLLAGTRPAREVWFADDMDDAPILDDIAELAREQHVPVRQVSRRTLERAAATHAPQGVLAKAKRLPEHDLDELASGAPGVPAFLVLLDGVTDPGNLGALLRSAECAGVTGVVLPRHRSVHVTPAVTKAAAGAVEHLPMAVVGGLPSAITRLRDLGVVVVGLDAAGAVSIHDAPLGDGPVALVLGAEGRGLSRLVRARCEVVASIPLAGHLASLNVAAAAAVACFEVVRRRAGR